MFDTPVLDENHYQLSVQVQLFDRANWENQVTVLTKASLLE